MLRAATRRTTSEPSPGANKRSKKIAPSHGATGKVALVDIHERFVEHMFLDDLCELEGNDPAKAAADFRRCLAAAGGIADSTRSAIIDQAQAHTSTLGSLITHKSGISGIRAIRLGDSWRASIRTYIAHTTPTEGDLTVVLPFGYYNAAEKFGHACAMLVHVRGDDAVVGVADTAETATTHGYCEHVGTYRVVAVRRTDRKTACGILEFTRNVGPFLTEELELRATKDALLAECGRAPALRPDIAFAVQPDQHLAARVLGSQRGSIVSHAQRQGTCTFHTTLWALGLADALATDGACLEGILGDDGGDPALILARVCHIDAELKKLGFARLLAGHHPEVAELVASDYSRCAWLDTRALRAMLWARTPREEPEELVVECEVIRVATDVPALEKATSLADLAAWIRRHGRAFGRNERVLERATAAAFALVSRDLLVKPVDFAGVGDSDATHVLDIARYVFSVRKVHGDAAIGMSMRCVRYAAHIARAHHRRGTRVAMPPTFRTSLPWAAAEYHALQAESARVAHVLFHQDNVARMAAIESTDSNVAGILSTNEFHSGWLARKEERIAERRKRIEGLTASDEATQRLLSVERAKADQAVMSVEAAKRLAMSQEQFLALRYVRSRPELAVLNVAVALLLGSDSGLSPHKAKFFVFGFDRGVRFCPTRHDRLEHGYSLIDFLPIHTAVSLVTTPPPPASHDSMAQNMEYLYHATTGRGRDDGTLALEVTYPRPKVALDVESLVRWADSREPRVGGLARTIREHVLPLSARGPTDAGLARLRGLLPGMQRENAAVAEILASMRQLIDGRVTHDRLQWPADETLLTAYMTIAAHTGTLAEVVERQAGVAACARTDPDASWSLTPLALRVGDTALVRGTETFVFAARGGGAARVHNALVAACRFDHWRDGDSSRLVTEHATILATPRGTTVTLRAGTFAVHGACEWWDPTYGAAVLPLRGDAHATRLVVIPGDRSRSRKCTRFPGAAPYVPESVRAYLDSLPKAAFVVELDAAGVLPAASTPTDELVCLFVAYAYAGSRIGTRMMPLVASRSVSGNAAIRGVIHRANCPLGTYVERALFCREYRPDATARELRTTAEQAGAALVRRIRVEHDEGADARRRARFSFVVQYGEPELAAVYEALVAEKRPEIEAAYASRERDEWTTTLSATTARFVRDDQRRALRSIASEPWCVAQMQMGFGKSSVIVPLLVAAFVSRPEVRIVFVTQPPHLVPAAARTVGALVAAHPYVEQMPLYAVGAEDMRRMLYDQDVEFEKAAAMDLKLVVVLSTADMQCIVRDYCGIYAAHGSIAHIADEVDAESDPMRCEVVVEGPETLPHYDEGVDVEAYYELACDLALGATPKAKVDALDGMCTGPVAAGTRLLRVFETVRSSMVHRTHYGMSDDESKLVAVPFPYAGVPSATKDFSDLDVAIAVLALSLSVAMRPCDVARLRESLRAKFPSGDIFRALEKTPALMARYYLVHIAMRELRTSTTETAVSFVDVLGAADALVGFSGTMGHRIEAPRFDDDDPRAWCSARKVRVLGDASDALVDAVIARARCIRAERDDRSAERDRARAVVALIRNHAPSGPTCIVDGSGEFGAFHDDVAELRATWPDLEFFGDDGKLVRREMAEQTVRYYSHRNSRGVDEEMPIETTGFVVLSMRKSRRSEIAQAAFRLRKHSLVEPSQTLVLVVTDAHGELTGATVLASLVANEAAYAAGAASLLKAQHAHAARSKSVDDPESFVRDVVYTDVAHTGEQQREQVVEAERVVEVARVETRALVRDGAPACYEKLKDAPLPDLTLANRSTKTRISDSLAALRIGLSPMITIRELAGDARIRRAFAVNPSGLVVLTVVEAWALYERDQSYAYYTEGGERMFGEPAAPDDVLLGRFLCDDTLSVLEEIALLRSLASKYASDHELRSLQQVIECLVSSRFLSSACVALHELTRREPARILRELSAESLTAKLARGDTSMSAAILPIVAHALSFGTRRAFI